MSNIKIKEVRDYLIEDNSSLNTVRTLILFGKNVSTYKFVLCQTLMQLRPQSDITYEDIKTIFVKSLLEHYIVNKHQFNSGKNKLTQAMDSFHLGELTLDELMKVAEKTIYNNVFDAFQNVGKGTIDDKYRLFEHDKKSKKLIITDNLNSILENQTLKELIEAENESRWKVVEEAWSNKINPNFLEYNKAENTFYSVTRDKRTNLRAAVDILAPYQKERCFYCNREINRKVDSQDDSFPDVDHFLPFSIIVNSSDIGFNPNGVWNLVVSCKACNRGKDGKFDAPPSKVFYEKLKKRNLLYVEEHRHSLKNSILMSLGASDKVDVGVKMDELYKSFSCIKGWSPKETF